MINCAFHLTCRRFWINAAVARLHSRSCSTSCIASIHYIIDSRLSLYKQRLHTLTEQIFADLGQMYSKGHISRIQLCWKYPLGSNIRSDSGYITGKRMYFLVLRGVYSQISPLCLPTGNARSAGLWAPHNCDVYGSQQ